MWRERIRATITLRQKVAWLNNNFSENVYFDFQFSSVKRNEKIFKKRETVKRRLSKTGSFNKRKEFWSMDSPGPLDLPESVWLKILRHLSADNLLSWTNLTEVERNNFVLGNRLFHLCGDKDLWRQIIWKGGKVKPVVLRKIIKFLGPHTEKIWLVLHNCN